ncbi:MAG: Ig-like domain-containing protein [Actinocatenispora sp.]
MGKAQAYQVRRWSVAGMAVGALVISAVTAGCTASTAQPKAHHTKPTVVTVSAPADKATDVPAGTPLRVGVVRGHVGTVAVTDGDGANVPGQLDKDGTWLPDKQLAYHTTYHVTARAKKSKAAAHSTFTTMARPSADKLVQVSSYVSNDASYGVGLPIVVSFGHSVPKRLRADVQRRMVVDSTPHVVGAWHWWAGNEVHFRPKDQWPTGTRFTVRLALGGVPMGAGYYGANNLELNAKIADNKLAMDIDDRTKTLTVTRDDKVIRKIPVSLGAAGTPTSSGRMVVMTRNQSEVFDSSTFGVPADSPGGYRETVYWDLRFTWDGQYIHAAPWSVGDQGSDNVSHGCVNVSDEAAQWLFARSHVGDPVTVRNTGAPLDAGDGWTDWNMSWTEFLKGSALRVDPDTGE